MDKKYSTSPDTMMPQMQEPKMNGMHMHEMENMHEMNEMYRMPLPNTMQNAMPQNVMPGYFSPSGPCIPQETVIRNVKLAYAYVPFQKLCSTYSPMEGLRKGTIFPELYSPYEKEEKHCK